MRIPHGSRRSTPEPERSPRVRFSSVPPSTPLFTFSVLEWTPASGLLAHLYPKRATSLQRLANNASTTSTEEERRDPRDRVVFENTAGTWSCFRQISCCGDVLVLEDAETIDVGPPRRHEYTWQQGPGRLPSVENGNTSFGANGGWRQTLASVTQSVSEQDADAARHGTLVSRPSHHRREIPLQDVHSVRRHVFKRPLPLTFNYDGRLSEGGTEEPRASRSKGSHHNAGSDDLDSLEWRYELWGPVGLIFMLRGGARLFLVFASGQHAEQMEELLIDFASGRGLQRRQRQASAASVANAAAAAAAAAVAPNNSTAATLAAPTNLSESAGHFNGAGSPVSPGVPGSPAVSYASLRLASPEASFQVLPSSPLLSLANNSLALADAAAHRSSSAGFMASGASIASAGGGTPSLAPQPHPRLNLPGPSLMTSASAFTLGTAHTNTSTVMATNTNTNTNGSSATPLSPTVNSTSASSRASLTTSPKTPAAGYLYCRPWGEAVRHLRYYLRPASASPLNGSLVRLSRHRLHAWQKIRQTLGQEPRCVAMDLRLTYLTPSSTHENVFRVESVVDTYAQYKDVVPLGGAVATAGPGDEAPSMMAARRREMELCRARPIVFEALAKTREERAEWLAWLQARGATVLRPEATAAPHMTVAATKNSSRPVPKPAKESFQPLGHQYFPSSPAGSGSAPELSGANSVDRWVATCGVPSSGTELSPTADPLGGTRPQLSQPQLPLKESDSERGSTSASLRAKRPTNSPMRYPQPHPHPMRFFSRSPKNPSKASNGSSSSPDPFVSGVLPPRPDKQSSSSEHARYHHPHPESQVQQQPQPARASDDFDENGIVVEDDERDARLRMEEVLHAQQREEQNEDKAEKSLSSNVVSPNSPMPGGPDTLDHTIKPTRRDVLTPNTTKPRTAVAAPDYTNNNINSVSNGAAGIGRGSSSSGGLNSGGGGSGVMGPRGVVAAHGGMALNSPGEEGATTDHTLTGTGPTVMGDPRTPMYMEDTSSSSSSASSAKHKAHNHHHRNNKDANDSTPLRASPSLSCTVAGDSPHSKTPSVRSPSTLQQQQPQHRDGGHTHHNRQATTSYRSTPVSPQSTVTDKEEKPTFDSAPLTRPPASGAVGNAGGSDTDSAVLRTSATELIPLITRPDTAVYCSDIRGSRTSAARAAGGADSVNVSVPSSTMNGTREPTATIAHSRSSTASPDRAGLQDTLISDEQGNTGTKNNNSSLHATPVARPSPQPMSSSSKSPSCSPSPSAPETAAPGQALRAALKAATSPNTTAVAPPSAEASPVSKLLFSAPTSREDDGVQTRDTAERSVLAMSAVLLPPAHDGASLSGSSPRPIKLVASMTTATDDGSGEWSGFKTGAETFTSTSMKTTPERRLDPRLSQFFTPALPSSGEADRSGERKVGSPAGPRVIAVPSGTQQQSQLNLRSGNFSTDSFGRASAARRSLHDSPLPPSLPPRVGSLTSNSRQDTPVDNGLRARAGLTVGGDRIGTGSEGGLTPLLHSGSSRGTYRDSEHLSSSMPFQSREVMEQRKRAFRDSLFINQE